LGEIEAASENVYFRKIVSFKIKVIVLKKGLKSFVLNKK
jgi:hypothetical protein